MPVRHLAGCHLPAPRQATTSSTVQAFCSLAGGSAYPLPRLSALGCLTSFACAGPPMPSADFCEVVREDGSALSPSQDTSQISRGQLSYRWCIDAGFIKHSPLWMEDFTVACPLVPTVPHLVSGSCSSPRTFVPRFLQTPPRGDALALPLSFGSTYTWTGDFHPRALQHARHTRAGSAAGEARPLQPEVRPHERRSGPARNGACLRKVDIAGSCLACPVPANLMVWHHKLVRIAVGPCGRGYSGPRGQYDSVVRPIFAVDPLISFDNVPLLVDRGEEHAKLDSEVPESVNVSVEAHPELGHCRVHARLSYSHRSLEFIEPSLGGLSRQAGRAVWFRRLSPSRRGLRSEP